MINVATMSGIAIGSIVGGELISCGRRRTLFIMNFVILISAVLSVFLNFWSIVVGKLLLGVAAGAF